MSTLNNTEEIDHSAFLERIIGYLTAASQGVNPENTNMPSTRKSVQRPADAGNDNTAAPPTLRRVETDPDYEEEMPFAPATRAQAMRPSRKRRLDAEIRGNSKYANDTVDFDNENGDVMQRSSSPLDSPENSAIDSLPTNEGKAPPGTTGFQVSKYAAPPTKRQRLTNEHPPTFTGPGMKDKDLQNDLVDFGFSDKQVKNMLSKKEPHWDPATPTHILVDERATQATREKRERTKKRNSGAEEQYKPLFLKAGSGTPLSDVPVQTPKQILTAPETAWALFDPTLGYPADFKNPPPFFDRFSSFKSGNRRILEYNTNTQSVRIRSTPPVLKAPGKGVDYTKTGPKIIDEASAVVVKRGRGRPRKHPSLSGDFANSGANADVVSKRQGTVPGKARRPRMTVRAKSSSETSDDSELTDLELEDEAGVKNKAVGEEIEVKQESL